MAAIDIAIAQLKNDEGKRLHLYQDEKGNWTIGYGYNLSANPIPENVADLLLLTSTQVAEQDCQEAVSNFDSLSDVRQAVLIGMAFNLGRQGFGEFTTFFDLIEAGDFSAASDDLLKSLAAQESPARYQRYAEALRAG